MASAAIKGITIKLDGDTSGLVKSLDNVEKIIKEDDAALKRLDKALKLDPTNVDLLAAKQQILAEKTEAVSEKMELLKDLKGDALEAIGDGADIATSSMAELESQIAFTSASLNSLEAESAATDAALNGFGDSTDSSVDGLDELGNSAEDAGESLDETGNAAEDAGDNIASAGDIASAFGAAAETACNIAVAAFTAAATAAAAVGTAIVAGTSQIVGMAKELADTGDEIDKMSQKVGLSSEAYQKWDYVMQIGGSEMSNMKNGLKTLYNELDKAKEGNEKAIDSFSKLGFSVEELKDMDREQLFEETIKRLSQLPDTAERAALAQDLLGKSGLELAPVFNMGAEEIENLLNKSEEYGMVLSEDLVADSAKFKDSMTTLDKTFEGFKNNLVGQFLPGLTMVTDGLAGLIAGVDGSDAQISKGIDEITSTLDKLIPQIEGIIKKLVPVILPLGKKLITTLGNTIIDNLPELITFATEIITSFANALLQPTTLSKLMTTAVQIIITLVNGLVKALPNLVTAALQAIQTLATALLDPTMITSIIDAAAQIALTIVNGLSNSIGTFLPQIAAAFLLIVQKLTDPEILGPLLTAVLELVIAICDGLMNSMDEIGLAIVTIIANVIIVLGEHLPEIIEFIVTTTIQGLGALFNLIIGMFGGHIEDIFGNFSDIAKFIADWFNTGIANILTWLVDLSAKLVEWLVNVGVKVGEGCVSLWEKVTGLWNDITTGFSTFFTNLFNGIVTLATSIVNKVIEIKDSITDKIKELVSGAFNWGKDLMQNLIDGINSLINKVKDTAKSVANAIAEFLHFSVPEKGPLHDFDESGADMIDLFIKSMNSQQAKLQTALSDTAGLISDEMNDVDFDSVKTTKVHQTIDYSGGLSKIEQALTTVAGSFTGSNDKQIIIPVYIGNEKLDTLIVDGIDRYNYTTGGH